MASDDDLFSGDGSIHALLRSHDWSDFGPRHPAQWPAALRMVMQLMLDSNLPMFVAWGSRYQLLYNEAYADLIRDQHPAAFGAPFLDIWPETPQDFRAVLDRARHGAPTFSRNVEFELVHNGHAGRAWFTFSVSPLRIDDGSVAGVFATSLETTAQVLADRRQTAESGRLQRLFHQAPGFMALLRSPEHVFELANDAFCRLVGHRELVGKSVREAFPEVVGQGFFELLDRVYTSREPFLGRMLPLKVQAQPDAAPEERFVDFVYQPITEADGRVTGIFVEGSDVTAQYKMQRELEALNRQLNAKVGRLEAAERRQACQLDLTDRLRMLTQPEDMMDVAAECLGRHLGASCVLVFEAEEGGTLSFRRCVPQGRGACDAGDVLPLAGFGDGIDASMRAGIPVAIDDVAGDSRTARHAAAYAAIGAGSGIWMPLLRSGRLATVVGVHRAGASQWSRDEEQLVREAAERTWGAIDIARAQAALRIERDQSQHIFDSMTEGFVMLDRDWTMVRVNAEAARLCRKAQDELSGRNLWEAMPETRGTPLEALFRQVQAAGVAESLEYHHTFPGGAQVWVELRVYPALDDRLAVFLRDISARKRDEQALRETAARLQFTLDSAEIGEWFFDLVSGTSTRSLRHDQCFGYGEPVLDWNFEKFIRHVFPDDRQRVTQQFETAISSLSDWHVECRVVWPDHSVHWIAAHGSIYHAGEHPTGMSGIVFDITERKLAEEELRKTDRRKDEFLAMLAHELRNPLAPIGAAAQLLSIARLDEARVRKTSEVIARQVGHMTSLIDDLLDVSRVTRGLVTLNRETLDLKDIVAEAVEQVRPLIEARHHRLELHFAPETTLVEGDRKRLVQVLANLLSNAAKYTPESGGIDLHIDAGSELVTMSVADNGIGMQPDLVGRVFELFAQAERTSDRSQGGLGIGLAIVRSLVELHGGTIRAHSAGLGAGSEFRVSLPRVRKQAEGAAARSRNVAVGEPAAALRVLVVDDNVDAAQMLALFIETAGHVAGVEHDPRMALERARGMRPDVCLLDIGLPGLDGNELARRLRAMPEMAQAVLIAVTGYGQSQDRESAFAAGFDHHFVKPIDTGKLMALLAEIVAQGA
jgi:PAS domain S-box-containing protein